MILKKTCFLRMVSWPSGKAELCKSFIPGSNPGDTLENKPRWWNGRHTGLKILGV